MLRNDDIACPLSSLPSAFSSSPRILPPPPPPPLPSSRQPASGTSPVELLRRYIESLPRAVPFRVEIRSPHFWRAVWTEFVATLLLLVVGCGAAVRWSHVPRVGCADQRHLSPADGNYNDDGAATDLKGALGFGLVVAALFHSVVNISGCHLNPAVSVTLLVTRAISPLRTASYITAQCLGAVVGAAILYGLTPVDVRMSGGLAATVPHPSVHTTQAFGVEFMITLFVALTFVANADVGQGESGFGGPALGISYVAGHLFGSRYTGAGMNPARSLALALVTNTWTCHWVYWVGPILGGIIGGITYEYIREVDGSSNCKERNLGQRYCKRPTLQQQTPQSGAQQRPQRTEFKREQSGLSSHETELTITSNDLRV